MSLEEYLERFVDENTQPADEEITLIIPNSQAETLGLFFINGLAGYIECLKTCRELGTIDAIGRQDENVTSNQQEQSEEFIN